MANFAFPNETSEYRAARNQLLDAEEVAPRSNYPNVTGKFS